MAKTEQQIPDEAWREAALEVVTSDRLGDGEAQVDDDCKVSPSQDGAYVQVWVWTLRERAADFAYGAAMSAKGLAADQD